MKNDLSIIQNKGVKKTDHRYKIGGSLYLRGTGITSLPDNLTVGGSLDLQGTGITSLPDNLTVGGYLDLQGTGITAKNAEEVKKNKLPPNFKHNVEKKLIWMDGKYRIFDGIFCEVLRTFKSAFKIKIGLKITFVVEVNGFYAHGETLEKARESLIYKMTDRDTSDFNKLTSNSVVTFEDAVKMYRTITGACAFGTQAFVESNGIEKRDYSVSEIIKKTRGQFGAEKLAEFFA